MWEIVIPLLAAIVSLAIGAAAGYYYKQNQVRIEQERQRTAADQIIVQAREQAAEIELQAKDKALQLRQAADTEVTRRRNEISG